MAVEEEPGIAAFEEGGQEPEHVAASVVEGSSQQPARKRSPQSTNAGDRIWPTTRTSQEADSSQRSLKRKSPLADTLILDIMRLQEEEPAQSPGLLTYTGLSYEF